MQEICTYHIQVRGQVDERELNKMSPLEIKLVQAGAAASLFQTRTDQSGLVGMIRHLHGQGFVLLSIIRK
jgi:hypothetical protein